MCASVEGFWNVMLFAMALIADGEIWNKMRIGIGIVRKGVVFWVGRGWQENFLLITRVCLRWNRVF